MASKYQLITAMYEEVCKEVARDKESWKEFLATAGSNYKLRFDEQLLIFAQRPDATAVLEIDKWNNGFGRWVNRGAKGIAVFNEQYDGKQRLKYYFDISDTHEGRNARAVPVWEMKAEYEEEVISALEGVYGELNNKSSLRTAIISAAENGAEDNMGDYFRDLLDCKTGSFLDDLDEENLTVIFRETLAESVSYLIEKRLGEAHIADDFDFQWMYSFNTKETLEVLGHAVSDISEMGLREVANTIRAYEKGNRTFEEEQIDIYNLQKETEKGREKDEYSIHRESGRSDSESGITEAGGSDFGSMGDEKEELLDESPESDVLQSVDFMQSDAAPVTDRKETTSDDIDAYDLIMRNKELLLDRNPKTSPVRFIFSHSALREGWDNPNVFQICTLKQSSSDVRKRQEVGRGLRLCVNQNGERMDANVLGSDVHNINVLTVIASESYDTFAKGLQTELADAVKNRPKAVTPELFTNRTITDNNGVTDIITSMVAQEIYVSLRMEGYIDKQGVLTDKYYQDKANGSIIVADEVKESVASIIDILDSVYDSNAMKPEDARKNNVELHVSDAKLAMPEFKALWEKINAKSVYTVDFDTDELVKKSIHALNKNLHVSKPYIVVEEGQLDSISSKEALLSGTGFVKQEQKIHRTEIKSSESVKYDLIGKMVEETGLTRKAIVQILTGIDKLKFDQFKNNPEEFIIKAAKLINDEKASAIIQHITYNVLDEEYGTDIFTESTIKGKLGVNAMKANKHLYDHIVYDSENERKFASDLDINSDVAVYVKLPNGFYISTPVGKYHPDWAIAFYQDNIKHIYFIAETKGSLDSLKLNHITPVEQAKIDCARKHFAAISSSSVVYDVVDSYQALLEKVMK